jgi:hypothetical protein
MGIDGNLLTASDEDIDAVLARPQRIERLLYGEPDAREEKPLYGVIYRSPSGGTVRVETILPATLHRIAWYVREGMSSFRKEAETDSWRPSERGEHLDLDRAWQGIHFLLTGTDLGGDPPLNFIHRPEDWVGDVDVGLGPARAVRSDEVREIAAELESLPREKIAERFDPERMMELAIYPEIWDRDPAEDDTLGYLLAYYDELRPFMLRAADRGHGLIIYH